LIVGSISDPMDVKLLEQLQVAIPITEHPFRELGGKVGASEEQVLERIRHLKAVKIIRQISAIFDTRSLGYASSLIAAQIEPARVDEAAAIFNLWYTIAISPLSKLGLARTVELLHRQSQARSTRLLPTLKLFKIGVKFDVGGDSRPDDLDAPTYTEKSRTTDTALTPTQVEFVRIMQRDLPIAPTPFVDYAKELGVTLAELQAMHRQFLDSGKMRRFAAVLHHRSAGFSANAMGVWAVPGDDAEVDRVGALMAGFRAVSHCYRRPSYPDWPYNIFTMVHGKSPEECEQTLATIAEKTAIREHSALYSTKEYKKVRVRYFTAEEETWEREHA
jgi:DNA-binding Lrp family transcriptional regulator